MVERWHFDKNWQQSWQQNHLNAKPSKQCMEQNNDMNNLDNKTILQNMASGIHLVVGLQLLSSCLEPVEKFLRLSLFREKYFWNHHYKKVILRSQLFPTCPKENGHRCLKSGWKQVGGTWSAVAAPPTRPPILYISLYVMVSIWYIICKNIYIYIIIY